MKLSGLKIMVTGAAGFIGSHLADRLAEDNELLLVDDFSIGVRENLRHVEARPNVTIAAGVLLLLVVLIIWDMVFKPFL